MAVIVGEVGHRAAPPPGRQRRLTRSTMRRLSIVADFELAHLAVLQAGAISLATELSKCESEDTLQ